MFVDTPVALFVFNRPELTRRVFARIAAIRPKRLLVVADGPRKERPEDVGRCAAARAITEQVDWHCAVERHYAESNMGCGARVSSGLAWVFSRTECAIILEDDCVPEPTFFRFCEELLDWYAEDERVMMISGDMLLPDTHRVRYSYYFSRYYFIWGWATWRRAWQHYDAHLSSWPQLRGTPWLTDSTGSAEEAIFWNDIFERVWQRKIDTWDFQWIYACMSRGGLSITPARNLVCNIGFGDEATHTTSPSHLSDLPTAPMPFPLRHPREVARDRLADAFTFERAFKMARPESDGVASASTAAISRLSGENLVHRLRKFLAWRLR